MGEARRSAEDYLETMLMLKEEHGYIRSVDVAHHLNVTKPSVSYATKRLGEEGYIERDENGLITLTASGMEIATHIYDRHKLLTKLFIKLGVSPKVAHEDACRIEHDISDETIDALRKNLDNLKSVR